MWPHPSPFQPRKQGLPGCIPGHPFRDALPTETRASCSFYSGQLQTPGRAASWQVNSGSGIYYVAGEPAGWGPHLRASLWLSHFTGTLVHSCVHSPGNHRLFRVAEPTVWVWAQTRPNGSEALRASMRRSDRVSCLGWREANLNMVFGSGFAGMVGPRAKRIQRE